MQNKINILIVTILLCALAYLALVKATDRICDKPFSDEFKATQQYADMKCPE